MKRFLCAFLILTCCAAFAFAELDVKSMSDEELQAAIEACQEELTLRNPEATNSTPFVAAPSLPEGAVSSIILDSSVVNLNKGSSAKLKATTLPDTAKNDKVIWETSDKSIATINAGQINAKGVGTCVITATAADGNGATASCTVNVMQTITGIKFEKASIDGFIGNAITLTPVISPKDASNTNLAWTSSDERVATVRDGTVSVLAGGTCEITATTTDGSDKSAKVKIHVPSISVSSTQLTVTDKDGETFDVAYYGDNPRNITASTKSAAFNLSSYYDDDGVSLFIEPVKAGKGTIVLKDSADAKGTVNIDVEIASSAVYDTKSYPVVKYEDVLRYPNNYDGQQVSITGKVIQKSDGYGGHVTLRVATRGSYKDVFYIEYNTSDIETSIIEKDKVTIYGICTGTTTYTTVMGASVTIPSINPEKIIINKKK